MTAAQHQIVAPAGLVARKTLTAAQRDQMFAMLAAHFRGVTRAQFERDLAEKNWVMEIRKDGRLAGFSTLLARPVNWRGKTLTAIYSGDTIMAAEGWGSPALARLWIASVNYIRAQAPKCPCFWLLLTSGFRTYRFLPVFWQRFFPRYDEETPADDEALLHHLATLQYGANYNAATGIVRLSNPQSLREELASIPDGRLSDPHIGFFLKRNPHHHQGDELACLTEITESNLTAAGFRMVRTESTP